MRKHWAAGAALILLAGCTAPGTPGTTTTEPPPAPPATTTTDAPSPAPSGEPAPSFGPSDPSSPSAAPTGAPPADSLEAAFANPDAGGIGAFLAAHPDYLPGTVVIGEVIVSGAARGPLELNLRNVPAGTTRMFMTIACTESKPYRMELTRDNGPAVGASWADSCGYWGGLNGYTTTPFDPSNPPTKFTITVAPETRYSYVLYASPGR